MKAILFDMDGVLVDACHLHRQALNQALTEIVGYSIPPDDYAKYEGLPTKNKLLILSTQGIVAHSQFEQINARKQELTFELIPKFIHHSMPIVHLFWQGRRAGLGIGVVTNCSPETAKLMLSRTGVEPDVLVTNADVKHPKPDPEGLLIAMEHLNAKPSECYYVGDQPVDAKAAHNAGIENYIHVTSPNSVCWELFRCRIGR